MFKRLEGPKVVKRRITIHIPIDGDNAYQKARMSMMFEIAAKSENERRMADFEAGDPDTDWLLEAVKGWDEYYEADGKTPIDFSQDELKKFLDVPYQRIAAVEEYFAIANGGAGKRKN